MSVEKKRIFLILLVLLLSACTPKEKTISGIYRPLSCTGQDGTEYEIEDEILKIEDGGSGYFVLHGNRYEIHWELKGEDLYFEDSSGDTFSGIFRNGIIDGTYFNDIRYVFELYED